MLEALHFDIEVFWVVQWEMLWFFNNDLLIGGVILENVLTQPTALSKVLFFCFTGRPKLQDLVP